jgi:UDP-2-acetamido-3-amino-2,3-dideoxy-glucuronate N-acetyltransferase
MIGQFAFTGAGSVLVKDIPDFPLIVGNPLRVFGWMCVCGSRINFDEESTTTRDRSSLSARVV